MNLDELAAAVIGVEPWDKEELKQIQAKLIRFKESEVCHEKGVVLVDEALRALASIFSDEESDAAQNLVELNEKITALQALFDMDSDENWDESASEEKVEENTDSDNADDAGQNEAASAGESTEAVREAEAAPSDQSFSTGMEDDPELLAEFVSESKEHIQISETSLLDLESNPDDNELINAVFRAFHTIKGTSGFLGMNAIQKLAHRAENMLDRVRQGDIRITGGYADLALESVDMLKQMLEDIEDNLGKGPIPVPEGMNDLINRLEKPEQAGITSDTTFSQESDSDEEQVGDDGDSQEAEVSADDDTSAGTAGAGTQPASPEAPAKTNAARAPKKRGKKANVDETARVSTKRLDDLINMVGELVIANAMVAQNPIVLNDKERGLQKNVSQISKITRELQDLSISMRMVPLKGVFQKMLRLVRDLGKKSNKDVKFIIDGEDTEIDRTMVESLNDPLVHMIRNAMDHGVESAADRKAAGKTEKGTLHLRAFHAAGNVVIELQDNGKGLDRDKILAKAKKNGIVDPDKDLPDNEVFMLIFSAGLSTADKITDVSGRGVGMDVVKKNIESMRGRVEVTSVKGEGTKFTIRIPLTLAIIDSMLVKVGNEDYLVPTLNVSHAFRPEASAITTVQGKGEMVSLRGSLIPFFRVHEVFNVPNAKTDPVEGIIIVVVDSDGEECGLFLDQLVGKQQVVIKSLNKGFGDLDGISGAAILGDGKVGLILDINGVTQIARSMIIERNSSETSEEEEMASLLTTST